MPRKIEMSGKVIALLEVFYRCGLSIRDISAQTGIKISTVRSRLFGIIDFDGASRISQKMKGRVSPRKGAVLSLESKGKISESHRARRESGVMNQNVGSKRTPESRQRMREAKARFIAENPDFYSSRRRPHVKSDLAIQSARQRTRYKSLLRRLSAGKPAGARSEALGYTMQEFVSHVSSLMPDGASWADRESFHIDHIVPVAAFLEHGVTQPSIINALCNLRPMLPHENRAKSDKYDRSRFHDDLSRITESVRGLV